jgi:uncharacterized sulfatase
MKKYFATVLLAASALSLFAQSNVLFIVSDDLRTEIGCYGCKAVKTPNIDRLAAQGMRFDNAYVQAAFCNPSRVSLLTGLRPDRTKVLTNRLMFRDVLPDVVTLPQLFKQNGYYTYNLGKIFHGGARMNDPKSWSKAEHPAATDVGRKGEGRNLTGGTLKWCKWLAAEGTDEDQPDGQIAAKAVAFLKQKHDKPFFLGVGFMKPHDPFHAPAKYYDLYPPEQLGLYRDPLGRPADSIYATGGGGFAKAFDKFTDTERREFLRSYYACISFMDAQLGKVLDALESTGLDKSTIVILISDHGYHLGERNWWNKNTLFELTARTPMIAYVPRMKAKGRPCKRIVEFVDIYPTLTELCGITPPPGLAGRSFAPLLDDPKKKWKEAAFMQLIRGPVMGRTIRTERFRYTEWDKGQKGAELYDHQNDPGEYYNLIRNARYAAERKTLRERLRAGPK